MALQLSIAVTTLNRQTVSSSLIGKFTAIISTVHLRGILSNPADPEIARRGCAIGTDRGEGVAEEVRQRKGAVEGTGGWNMLFANIDTRHSVRAGSPRGRAPLGREKVGRQEPCK